MLNFYPRLLLLLFGLLSVRFTHAQQVYPVLSTLQINPPYSLYLNDYASAGSDKMQVNLFLKDLTKSNYPCRLRFKLEGFGITIQNKNDFYLQPFYLNPGELSSFSGSDLEPYFNPKNLVFQGLDQGVFSRNGGKLPEGVYRISVEVLDYYQRSVVSNAGSTVLSVFLSYPPIINSPLPFSKVQAVEPQNVIFQWVPRHTGSINAAYHVAYNFRLVELIPPDRDPNDAIRSTRPLFETVTDQTILLYGPAEPALTPGNSYAVQVQAVEAEGKDLFINNGNSEVVKFTYGDKCAPPLNILAQLNDQNSLKLSWDALPLQQAFTIRYREAGNRTAEWFEQEIYTPQYIAQGLRPGKTYEYQVKAQCMNGYGDYTPIQQFRMPDEALTQGDFVCGKQPESAKPDKKQLLDNLLSGNVFMAGDFSVTVTSITASQNGKFSGTGTITVPVLSNLQFSVIFTNISINSKYQMVDGVVKVGEQTLDQSQEQVITAVTVSPDTNGLVKAVSSNGLPTIIDVAIAVPENLPVYNAASKTIKFSSITNSGETKEITIKLQDNQPPFTFQDKNGQTYEVEKDGTVTARGIVFQSELLAGGSSTSKPLTTDKAKIIFKPSTKQKYGLDLFKEEFKNNSRYTDDYQKTASKSSSSGDGTVYISWKSIESGRGDEVLAELQTKDPSINPDKVEFRNSTGETISSKREGNTYTIQLLGAPEGNDKEVYAFYQTGKDKNLGINLGKLNIASFKKITKKVVVVPVNGAGKGLSESTIRNSLNEVYKQAIVEWDVELAPNFVPAADWDTNQNGLDVGNSSTMSTYTAEQKALAGMYKKQAGLKDGTYYIFLVNKFSDPGQQGYMVRGGQVGFCLTPALSEGEGAISRALSHELGHGAFSLQHTWDVLGDGTKEKTSNLMDYSSSLSQPGGLWHYQWKYMRNPDLVFRPFEGDEEGAYLKTEYFVAINGYPIQIKDINIKRLLVAPSKKHPSGTLYGYRNKSDEEYLPYFQNDQFMGYQNQKTQAVLKPVLITGKKELTVQFLETTNTKCVYRLSTGKYAIPANINTIVPENIIKPVKRDTSINITNEQCQDLALDPLTGPFASTESSKITNFLSRVKANTGIKISLVYLDINDPEYAKKLEETKKKNAEGITLIAKMQESKNQQPGLNIIPFEFVDFEVNDPCTFDKISKAHQEFIKSSYFKTDDPILSKVREVGYISYKTLFAHLECATSEEIALKLYPDTLSVTHKAWQSTYGFTNGLVSNFDLLAAIEGAKELGKGILEMSSDNYLSYAKDMIGLLANPPNISDFQEPEKLKKLFTKLSPPTLRNDLQALDKGVNVVNGLWKFYATQGNYWRSGQLAATVIPIVLTGGELAATKIKGWIKGTDKAANLLKTAKKLEQTAGNTVNVIDEAGNVKTITLEGNELVVKVGAKTVSLWKTFLDDAFVISKRAEVIADELPARFPNLSIDELTAIKVYTSDQVRNGSKIYQTLNTELRAGNLSDFNKGLNGLVNSGLGKLTPNNGNVFRGVYGVEANLAKTWKVGDEIQFKEFKSSSINKQVAAYDFADNYNSDIFYEIIGAKGANVCGISCIPNEMEVLLKSNLKFKVKEIQPNHMVFDKNFELQKPFTRVVLEIVQ